MCLRQRGKLVQGAGEDPLKRTAILTEGEGVAGRENSKQRGVWTTKALGIQRVLQEDSRTFAAGDRKAKQLLAALGGRHGVAYIKLVKGGAKVYWAN